MDLVFDETVSGVDDDDSSAVDIPEKFEYICLENMNEVNAAVGIHPVQDFLVVLQEYKQLCDMMEKSPKKGGWTKGIVVTGQPGIGSYRSQFVSELNADLCNDSPRQDHLPPIPYFASSGE